MKNLLLIGSLLANGVLVAVLVLRSGPGETAPLATPAAPSARDHASEASPTKVVVPPPALVAADDFAGLPARLQAAGLSAEIARFATTAAVKQHYNDRRLALGLRPDPADFTKIPITSLSSESPEKRAMQKALDDEEREQLDTLFGTQPEFSLDTQRRFSEGLPADKAEKLRKILADYRAIQARLNAENAPGRITPEMQSKTAMLKAEMRIDLERLLTPDELLTYDLRNSSPAGLLRNRLGAFQATEDEFRSLYPLFKAAEEAGIRRNSTSLDPEMQRVLGEARFAEMQEANAQVVRQSQAFVEARAFVISRNLPPAAANDLLLVQAEYYPRVAALEQAKGATPDQREAQLAALRESAKARLLRLFGPEGFEAYVKAKGSWLEPAPNRAR